MGDVAGVAWAVFGLFGSALYFVAVPRGLQDQANGPFGRIWDLFMVAMTVLNAVLLLLNLGVLTHG